MGKRLERYKNNIKVQYDVCSEEIAYQYNRGYIIGLSDGKAISTKSGYTLVQLNHSLRMGGK